MGLLRMPLLGDLDMLVRWGRMVTGWEFDLGKWIWVSNERVCLQKVVSG